MELEFSKLKFQFFKNFTWLELEFARLDFQGNKKFTQLELEFAKLEFHVVYFFIFNSTLDLCWSNLK